MTFVSLTGLEVLVAVTAAQRLAELVHSRRNLRALPPGSPAADSSTNWVALVVLQSAWLVGSALEPWLAGRVAGAPVFWTGLGLFLLGAALRVWCIVTLGTRWNARARVARDLVVVSTGPYRFVRHPNYLGVLLEVLGLPLAGGAWATLGLLGPAHVLVLLCRIRGEDRLLSGVPGYAQAMADKAALLPLRFHRRG